MYYKSNKMLNALKKYSNKKILKIVSKIIYGNYGEKNLINWFIF